MTTNCYAATENYYRFGGPIFSVGGKIGQLKEMKVAWISVNIKRKKINCYRTKLSKTNGKAIYIRW